VTFGTRLRGWRERSSQRTRRCLVDVIIVSPPPIIDIMGWRVCNYLNNDDIRYALRFVCVVFTRWMFPQRLWYMFFMYIIVFRLHCSINFTSRTTPYTYHASTHLLVYAMSMFGIHGDCHFACNRSSVAVAQRCVYTDMYIFNRTQHIYNGCMFVYTITLVCLQVNCVVVCCMFMRDSMRLELSTQPTYTWVSSVR
jgi:hypothetical protein